jgi:hypothetical protein
MLDLIFIITLSLCFGFLLLFINWCGRQAGN